MTALLGPENPRTRFGNQAMLHFGKRFPTQARFLITEGVMPPGKLPGEVDCHKPTHYTPAVARSAGAAVIG
jgi:hypothetical protein